MAKPTDSPLPVPWNFIAADTIKVQLQLAGKKKAAGTTPPSIPHVVSQVVQKHGARGLWRGLSPGIQRQLVFASLRVGLYEHIRDAVATAMGAPTGSGTTGTVRLISSLASGAIGITVASPTDLVKVRLQAQARGQLAAGAVPYKGSFDAYRRIIAEEGGLRALWRGYVPNLARNSIISAAELSTYDTAKHFFLHTMGLPDTTGTFALCGLSAGAAGTLVGNPVDVLKTRIMNTPGAGFAQVAKELVAEEGFRGFYAGSLAQFTRIASWNIVFFVAMENLRAAEEFLARHHLAYKQTATHYVVKECPLCHKPTYGKRDNMWKLYIDTASGAWICHRCGAAGSWFDFKQQLAGGHTPATEPAPATATAAAGHSSTPSSTASTSSTGLQVTHADMLSWVSAVKESSSASAHPVTHWLTSARGLSSRTIAKYGVGATTLTWQGKAHPCVAFPWWMPVSDDTPAWTPGVVAMGGQQCKLARVKLRSILDKSRMLLAPTGGEWGVFGAHTVPLDATQVVVTEGELDAMAVWQATGMPAVSLPNGARSLPVELLPWFERFERIYLWLDADATGLAATDKMAAKLGRGRCWVVQPPPTARQPPKDANDALRAGSDMPSMLARAVRLKHEGVLSARELLDAVAAEVRDPDAASGVPMRWLPSLQTSVKGLRPGELTVLTGPTGCGKTTLLAQITLDAALQGVPCLWGSFEVRNSHLLRKLITQMHGQRSVAEEFQAAAAGLQHLPMYFLNYYGSTDVDTVIDAMEYAVYAHDADILVLDNLQFMMSKYVGRGGDKFESQDAALDRFRAFASAKGVHLILVIHPRKEPSDAPLSLASVFGSAKATQEADNVWILQSVRGNKQLDIKKNRFSGDTGSIELAFDSTLQRFYEKGTSPSALPLPSSPEEFESPAQLSDGSVPSGSSSESDTADSSFLTAWQAGRVRAAQASTPTNDPSHELVNAVDEALQECVRGSNSGQWFAPGSRSSQRSSAPAPAPMRAPVRAKAAYTPARSPPASPRQAGMEKSEWPAEDIVVG